MSRLFQIEIAESAEELKKRLQTAPLGNQKEKLQMLWWLACMVASLLQQVEAFWDSDAEVWVAASDDIPGLVTKASTIDFHCPNCRLCITAYT